MQTIGIVGLGLIGGSLAKAYRAAGKTVYAADRDETTLGFARVSEVIDGTLDQKTMPECDLVLIALYPADAIAFMDTMAPYIRKDALVIDCCGTKRQVCECGFALAEQYGFTYVGGHPMAGTQYTGFKNSRVDMFDDATMIIVPPRTDDILLFDRIKKALRPAGFTHVTITTADHHDAVIAYTSQLAHVVSSAFVKSPTAQEHRGYSAGSYRDMTRVARLNEAMWTDLFMENRDYLLQELDRLIDALGEYRQALADCDDARMLQLLREGREHKEKVDQA